MGKDIFVSYSKIFNLLRLIPPASVVKITGIRSQDSCNYFSEPIICVLVLVHFSVQRTVSDRSWFYIDKYPHTEAIAHQNKCTFGISVHSSVFCKCKYRI